MYTVTLEAGPNGTAAVSSNRVEEGGLVFITAHPDDGYEVEAVTANGKPLTASREGIYAIFNITEDQKITVTFAQKGIVTAEDSSGRSSTSFWRARCCRGTRSSPLP